jgi:hypothetical protein
VDLHAECVGMRLCSPSKQIWFQLVF